MVSAPLDRCPPASALGVKSKVKSKEREPSSEAHGVKTGAQNEIVYNLQRAVCESRFFTNGNGSARVFRSASGPGRVAPHGSRSEAKARSPNAKALRSQLAIGAERSGRACAPASVSARRTSTHDFRPRLRARGPVAPRQHERRRWRCGAALTSAWRGSGGCAQQQHQSHA